MNLNSHSFDRPDYDETIHAIGVVHSVRVAKLNFLAPIVLVCALGCIARFIQSWLMN